MPIVIATDTPTRASNSSGTIGSQRGDAGGHRDRHGKDVVGEQCRGGRQARERPEVVACDDVRAAAVRIRRDGLAITRDDDRQHDHDADRDGHRQAEGRGPREHEDPHDLLGRVRGRRDVVRGEDRQARDHPEPLLELVVDRERAPEQGGLDATDKPAGASPRRRRRGPGHEGARSGVPEEGFVGSRDAKPLVAELASALGSGGRGPSRTRRISVLVDVHRVVRLCGGGRCDRGAGSCCLRAGPRDVGTACPRLPCADDR